MTNSKRLINSSEKRERLFRRLAILTVTIVYFLILVGGIVRSTGSGMGCPDWPKCFGSWVPPTEESQLPTNYKEIFGAKLKGEVEFDAFKTWTEYLNRLLGVVTGLFIFATLLASLPFRKTKPLLFYLTFSAFVLVGFQGWLGSKVVSSELAPYMITLHMLVAILIVFLLLWTVLKSQEGYWETEHIHNESQLKKYIKWAMLLTLLQILLGTQVREAVDEVMKELGESRRGEWIEQLGLSFYIHRSFSLVILALHIGVLYWLNKSIKKKGNLYKLFVGLLYVVVLEIVSGIILSYLSMPPYAQPIHLTLAIVAVGLQFVIWQLLEIQNKWRMKGVGIESEKLEIKS
ncbi:MAG: COX15/CtaA family protein [Runella sp.]